MANAPYALHKCLALCAYFASECKPASIAGKVFNIAFVLHTGYLAYGQFNKHGRAYPPAVRRISLPSVQASMNPLTLSNLSGFFKLNIWVTLLRHLQVDAVWREIDIVISAI